MAKGAGTGVALAEALGARTDAGLLPPEPEQLDLLRMSADGKAGETGPDERGKGRGRPAGSRNRRTTDWADYLIGQYGSPLELVVKRAMMDPAKFAELCKCSIMDAVQEQRLLAIAALPYLHQRQPVAVDVTNHRAVSLTIIEGGTAGAGEPDPVFVDIVDIQGVSDGRTG